MKCRAGLSTSYNLYIPRGNSSCWFATHLSKPDTRDAFSLLKKPVAGSCYRPELHHLASSLQSIQYDCTVHCRYTTRSLICTQCRCDVCTVYTLPGTVSIVYVYRTVYRRRVHMLYREPRLAVRSLSCRVLTDPFKSSRQEGKVAGQCATTQSSHRIDTPLSN